MKKKMLRFMLGCLSVVCIGIMGCGDTQSEKDENQNETNNVVDENKSDKVENEGDWSYLAAVQNEDGKWGYINEYFEEIIPCQFEYAEDFEPEGVAIVEIATETGQNEYAVIDLEGNILASGYDEIARVGQMGKEMMFLVGKEEGVDENGDPVFKFGYMNQYGEEIMECVYDLFPDILCSYGGLGLVDPSADFLSNSVGDVCAVSKNNNGKYEFSVMDAHRKTIIPFGKYDYIEIMNYNNKLIVGERIGLFSPTY